MMDDAAVLFVSHSMNQVSRICNLGCYMHKGVVKQFGDIQETIKLYNDYFGVSRSAKQTLNEEAIEVRYFVGDTQLQEEARIPMDAHLFAEIDTSRVPHDTDYRIIVRDLAKAGLQEWNSKRATNIEGANTMLRCDLGSLQLSPGRYTIEVIAMTANGRDHVCITPSVEFAVDGEYLSRVAVQRFGDWSREQS
jgi:hypothetical protein